MGLWRSFKVASGVWQREGQGPGQDEAGLAQGMTRGRQKPQKNPRGGGGGVVSVTVGSAAAARGGVSLLMGSQPTLQLNIPLQLPWGRVEEA